MINELGSCSPSEYYMIMIMIIILYINMSNKLKFVCIKVCLLELWFFIIALKKKNKQHEQKVEEEY